MSVQNSNKPSPVTNVAVAQEVESLKIIDQGGAYNLSDLGQVVQFADLMSKAGPMLPEHCQNAPAICLGITMRASHWGFDPFGLAQESFQVKQGAPVGYSAKVFVGALQNCAGITLKYRYEGTVTISDKPALSGRGNTVAPRSAKGNRRCIAYWTDGDGELLEYETPTLDNIGIKNSALWHNDPDQQLAYYAGRGWVRRFRPGVIMGAHSKEEAEQIASEMKDVTPKGTGFQRLAQAAKAGNGDGDAEDGVSAPTVDADEATPAEQEVIPPEDETPEPEQGEIINVMAPEYLAGIQAAESDFSRADCPHTDDPELARLWFAGFDSMAETDAQ